MSFILKLRQYATSYAPYAPAFHEACSTALSATFSGAFGYFIFNDKVEAAGLFKPAGGIIIANAAFGIARILASEERAAWKGCDMVMTGVFTGLAASAIFLPMPKWQQNTLFLTALSLGAGYNVFKYKIKKASADVTQTPGWRVATQLGLDTLLITGVAGGVVAENRWGAIPGEAGAVGDVVMHATNMYSMWQRRRYQTLSSPVSDSQPPQSPASWVSSASSEDSYIIPERGRGFQ